MSRQPSGSLSGMLDEVISQALADDIGMRPYLEPARARLVGVVTIAVTGRRGAGKTTVVNEIFSATVAEVGYSAEDRPAQFFASEPDHTPAWGVGTLVPASLTRGRRIVELPEHLTSGGFRRDSAVGGLAPDLLVHVTRKALRSDERDLLEGAQRVWSLGPLETLVVGTSQGPPGVIATSHGELRHRLQAVERLVEVRRCDEVMQLLAALTAHSDNRTWAERLVDSLERLSLTPQGHVLRERWALEVCLVRPVDIPSKLREEAVRRVLGAPIEPDREALLARAGHWRAQVSVLPPLAAEVARVVARRLQLDAEVTHELVPPEAVER